MILPIIEARNVSKVLGAGAGQVRAVKNLDLSIAGGKLTVLMGPSGSGKTTLLSILGCMLTPTEGTVFVCGDRSSLPKSAGSISDSYSSRFICFPR